MQVNAGPRVTGRSVAATRVVFWVLMVWSDVWCLCGQSETGGAAGGRERAPGGDELGPGGGGQQRPGGLSRAWRRAGPGGGRAAMATLRVAEAAEVSGRTGALPAELLAEPPGGPADRDRGRSGRSAHGVPRRQRALRHDGLTGRAGWRGTGCARTGWRRDGRRRRGGVPPVDWSRGEARR